MIWHLLCLLIGLVKQTPALFVCLFAVFVCQNGLVNQAPALFLCLFANWIGKSVNLQIGLNQAPAGIFAIFSRGQVESLQ